VYLGGGGPKVGLGKGFPDLGNVSIRGKVVVQSRFSNKPRLERRLRDVARHRLGLVSVRKKKASTLPSHGKLNKKGEKEEKRCNSRLKRRERFYLKKETRP